MQTIDLKKMYLVSSTPLLNGSDMPLYQVGVFWSNGATDLSRTHLPSVLICTIDLKVSISGNNEAWM